MTWSHSLSSSLRQSLGAASVYRLEISRRAAKTVTSLEKPLRRKILTAIDSLSSDPRPPGCRKLSGQEAWRIRVGDHRIVYEIHDQVLLVLVVDVGHRREIYR
jgi:mRNA interferase RelE/StbE